MGGQLAARQERKDRLAFRLLVLFGVLLYTVPSEWIAGLAPLRLQLVSSSLAAGLLVVRRVLQREALLLGGARGMALLGLSLLALASVAWSLQPEASRTQGVELIKSWVLYATLVNLLTTPRRLALFCAALVLASGVTSVGTIDWYLKGEDLVEGFRARWVGTYADPNRMAMSVGLVVPLAAALLVHARQGWLRWLSGAAAGLALTAMVLSYSRGGFIGLSAALLVWLGLERRLSQGVVIGLLCAGLLAFAPRNFWSRTESVTSFQQDASALGRVHAWTVASRINLERPLLGVGAGTFQQAWPSYAPPEARRAYAAHNVFIQVLAELGWVGFVLLLIFTAGSLGAAWEATADPESGWLARAIFASTTGYLVCSLSAGFLLSPHLYLVLGLATCAQQVAAHATREHRVAGAACSP